MQQRHLLLDPARGEEKSSEIRQHDGVMTDAVVITAGLRRAPCVGVGRCDGRGRGARAEVRLPSPPHIYIGGQGGASPLQIQSARGSAARDESPSPKASGGPPPLRVLTLGAGEVGLPWWCASPGGCTHPLAAWGPHREGWPHQEIHSHFLHWT